MSFPLDLFISQGWNPSQAQYQGLKMVGDAGEMMQNERLQQQKLVQNESQFQRTHALQTEEARGKNKYYEDLIEARKQGTAEKSQEQKEKRVAVLMDAFRRAKTPRDRDLIRQELTRLGYSVEEADTELPDTTTPQAPILSPLDAAPTPQKPAGKPQPPPKINPKFQAALAGEMAKDDDQFGLNEQPSAGEPAPMDWSGLGIPTAMAPQEKPKRGGRFTIRDNKGDLAMTYDEPAERQKSRMAVSSVLTPLIGQASNPEEKAAAQVATDAASNAIDAGFSMQEAAKFGADIYHKEMGRFKTEKRPGAVGTGGGGGMSRQEQSRKESSFDNTLNVVKEARAEEAVVKAREAASHADQIADLLSSDDPFQNRAALMEHLHSLIGSAQTKSETDNALGGAGKTNLLMMRINEWTDGGRMPDDIRRGLQTVQGAARRAAQKRIDDAGEKAYNFIKKNVGTMKDDEREQSGNAAFEMITGRPRGGGGGGNAAQSSGSEDERRKKLEEKLRGMNL